MMDEIDTHHGFERPITRSNLYEDVIEMYRKSLQNITREFPFCISYTFENAVDTGGVSRDLFSAFWEIAYIKHFDGEKLLVPTISPKTDLATLPLLGTILCHGFMACGYLPVRIAFPIITAVLLGLETAISDEIYLESLIDYISTHDSTVLRDAIKEKKFTSTMASVTLAILSRLGCTEIPTPANIKYLLTTAAQHQFKIKILGNLFSMRCGVPSVYQPFWKQFSVEKLYQLYRALNATPLKVLGLLHEPECMNTAEDRVFNYLKTFIGNMKQEELHRFLRYVTGSSVIINSNITVVFNSLNGLARRPISHTCDCTLELSRSYSSYMEFEDEFSKVLGSEGSCWVMDGI